MSEISREHHSSKSTLNACILACNCFFEVELTNEATANSAYDFKSVHSRCFTAQKNVREKAGEASEKENTIKKVDVFRGTNFADGASVTRSATELPTNCLTVSRGPQESVAFISRDFYWLSVLSYGAAGARNVYLWEREKATSFLREFTSLY